MCMGFLSGRARDTARTHSTRWSALWTKPPHASERRELVPENVRKTEVPLRPDTRRRCDRYGHARSGADAGLGFGAPARRRAGLHSRRAQRRLPLTAAGQPAPPSHAPRLERPARSCRGPRPPVAAPVTPRQRVTPRARAGCAPLGSRGSRADAAIAGGQPAAPASRERSGQPRHGAPPAGSPARRPTRRRPRPGLGPQPAPGPASGPKPTEKARASRFPSAGSRLSSAHVRTGISQPNLHRRAQHGRRSGPVARHGHAGSGLPEADHRHRQ